MDSCLSCRHAYIRPASQLQQPFYLFDPSLYRAIFTLSLCGSLCPLTQSNIGIHYRHSLHTQRGKVAHEHIIEFFTYRRQEYVGLCSDTVQIEETQRRGLLAQLQREDLCLSLCVSLQSHLFLSPLFALSSLCLKFYLSQTLCTLFATTLYHEKQEAEWNVNRMLYLFFKWQSQHYVNNDR